MSKESISNIVALCLSLDELAADTYAHLAKNTGDEALRAFWHDMARDEAAHIRYWHKLLELSEHRALPAVFEHPGEVAAELKEVAEKALVLKSSGAATSDTHTAFLLAFRMEFYLLHPAFEALFHLLKGEMGGASPEDSYAAHIEQLLTAAREFDASTPASELLSEFMHHLWLRNRDLAKQLSRVRTLGSLVPICASCKKIRDDEGYWEHVESYVKGLTGVSFSHGICPECREKLYPGLGKK